MWGSHGNGDGEFNEPASIAVDTNGYVYVADRGNNRIQKFTAEGEFLFKWGKEGSGEGEFGLEFWGGLHDIAVDTNGYVYVADTGNNRVQKFTTDGQFVAKWGNYGSGDGEFSILTGIAADTNGFVYVAGTCDIQKFTTDGQFVAMWRSDGSGDGEFFLFTGIAVDTNGFVYVADTGNNRIQKFSSDGQFVSKWGSLGVENGKFVNLNGIAVNNSGFVYVADSLNYSNIFIDRIQKFTADGQFVAKWGSYGSENGNFKYPFGIAVNSNGFVYVSESGNNRVQKFTTDGQFVAKWGSYGSGDGEFNYPLDIVIDTNGYVYVADTGNNRVQKFTADGQFVAKWGSEGVGNGKFDRPRGIAVDSSDFVYVADENNHRIQKFTSNGQFITKFGEFGSDPGQLNNPGGVCISTNGKMYVADSSNNRIQVFSQDGSSSTLKPYKAIIIAGGGPFEGNNIWDATEMCANYAYRALTYQGFTKETIYYLSSDTGLDLDGNGIPDDVDANATNMNLQYAITTWAKDTDDLFVYMVGHGGEDTFRMGELELLKAKDLDTWLDTLQKTITGNVTLLYDACRSGSFLTILDPPSGRERILATSASQDEEAIFGSQGTISFSFLFWGRMFNGDSFYDSFYHATNSIGVTYPQNTLLEGNGNGIGNEKEDKDIVRVLKIGNETKSAGDIPVIGSISPARTLDVETSALIYAENVIDADGVSRVWAVITPPDYSPGSSDNPVTDLPILNLTSTGNNRYEGTYTNFTSAGTYTIAVYASDRGSVISLPKATTVTISDGYAYGDVAPLGNRDGTVNVGDALVALRFALNLETPTQEDMEHGDVAPLDAQGQPNPDGIINVGDALVILRKALGIIGF
jgi:sugar lactone lactonase YvrE